MRRRTAGQKKEMTGCASFFKVKISFMNTLSKIPLLLVLTTFLLTFPACKTNQPIKPETESINQIELYESSQIIKELIYSNKLKDVLDPSITQQEIDSFILNYSPAMFAFEVEVLQCPEPVCVVFYDLSDQTMDTFKINVLNNSFLAQFKWVYVDSEKLFNLVDECQINTIPTLLIFKHRQEVANVQPIISIDECEEKLKALI